MANKVTKSVLYYHLPTRMWARVEDEESVDVDVAGHPRDPRPAPAEDVDRPALQDTHLTARVAVADAEAAVDVATDKKSALLDLDQAKRDAAVAGEALAWHDLHDSLTARFDAAKAALVALDPQADAATKVAAEAELAEATRVAHAARIDILPPDVRPHWPIMWLGHRPDDPDEARLYGHTSVADVSDDTEWALAEPDDHKAEREGRMAQGARF